MTDDDPAFDITHRPRRVHPPEGGFAYEGETIFDLSPAAAVSNADLAALVESVLADDAYTYGDGFDLPAPVYLVRDHDCGTVFRVVVRYERIEFHVLPNTTTAGLRAMYDRLCDATDDDWTVGRETSEGDR